MSKKKYIFLGLLGGVILPFVLPYLGFNLSSDRSLVLYFVVLIVFGFIIQFLVSKGDYESRRKKIILYWVCFILGLGLDFILLFLALASWGG